MIFFFKKRLNNNFNGLFTCLHKLLFFEYRSTG